MTETLTEGLTAELPRELYIIIHYDPQYDRVVPLFIPLPPVGFGMPVFEEREGAEEFVASPSFDIPAYKIKEITLENFIAAGENPTDIAREHGDEDEFFYMIDPRPWHEWKGVEDMGFLTPMRDIARVLREELREH